MFSFLIGTVLFAGVKTVVTGGSFGDFVKDVLNTLSK